MNTTKESRDGSQEYILESERIASPAAGQAAQAAQRDMAIRVTTEYTLESEQGANGLPKRPEV